MYIHEVWTVAEIRPRQASQPSGMLRTLGAQTSLPQAMQQLALVLTHWWVNQCLTAWTASTMSRSASRFQWYLVVPYLRPVLPFQRTLTCADCWRVAYCLTSCHSNRYTVVGHRSCVFTGCFMLFLPHHEKICAERPALVNSIELVCLRAISLQVVLADAKFYDYISFSRMSQQRSQGAIVQPFAAKAVRVCIQ